MTAESFQFLTPNLLNPIIPESFGKISYCDFLCESSYILIYRSTLLIGQQTCFCAFIASLTVYDMEESAGKHDKNDNKYDNFSTLNFCLIERVNATSIKFPI